MISLLASGFGSFSFPHFIIGFIFLCCAIAIVIILVKWLAGLAGFTIPPALMMVAGILLFMLLLSLLLNWSGYNIW
jgi:hypothetical protein